MWRTHYQVKWPVWTWFVLRRVLDPMCVLCLRGDRSITNTSEALIIIDGIPGDIGTLNPDDIASMNVLKGSSASALYGSDAANGAIIITTKKGAAGKTLAIYVNSSFQADKAVNLRDFQNEYSQGSSGAYLSMPKSPGAPKSPDKR